MTGLTIRHEFVEYMPEELASGVLYVSVAFATAVHKCCCGCGHEVVTPLSRSGWTLVFNGETVSLTPSIGSWGLACRSHYVIHQDRVQWVRPLSRGSAEREPDRMSAAQPGRLAELSRGIRRSVWRWRSGRTGTGGREPE